jgi:hypothetical protein
MFAGFKAQQTVSPQGHGWGWTTGQNGKKVIDSTVPGTLRGVNLNVNFCYGSGT